MDARPVLAAVTRLLAEHRLEAVLIGNAAAALLAARPGPRPRRAGNPGEDR